MMFPLPESLGDLVLEVFDGDDAEYECSPCHSFDHTGLVAVLAKLYCQRSDAVRPVLGPATRTCVPLALDSRSA